MNKNNRKTVANRRNHQTQLVHVEFTDPTAKAVAIAGTFNDWRPEVTPMICMGSGRWIKELALPPGRYEYLFVADARWIADPRAIETVPNPYGGVNSMLSVPAPSNAKKVVGPSK